MADVLLFFAMLALLAAAFLLAFVAGGLLVGIGVALAVAAVEFGVLAVAAADGKGLPWRS